MELIPAIDLRAGRAVRLLRGDYDHPIAATADPLEIAPAWAAAGVVRLHVVDLDGAQLGRPVNLGLIAAIARAARTRNPLLWVQAGGGLRDESAVERVLDAGVDVAIVGSAALRDPGFLARCAVRWPGRVGAALDLRGGRPAVDAWRRELDVDAGKLADRLAGAGAAGLVVTDVDRDGTGGGPNLELVASLRRRLPATPLVASGGVSRAEHLRALAALRVDGAIVGRALLEGTLPIPEALAACQPVPAA